MKSLSLVLDFAYGDVERHALSRIARKNEKGKLPILAITVRLKFDQRLKRYFERAL